jgi:hypothetical protein
MKRFLATALLGAVAALPAQALLITDASLLTPAAAPITFDAYDGFVTTGPEMLDGNLIFTGDTDSVLGAFIADLGQNGLWGAGNVFAGTDFFGELRFTFANGLLAQGLGAFVSHYADDVLPFTLEISAYGANNQIVETHRLTIDTAADSLNDGLFVGILRPEADIRSVSFKGVVVVDDVVYTTPVPEPGTWLTMGLGLLGLGFWQRRRIGLTR